MLVMDGIVEWTDDEENEAAVVVVGGMDDVVVVVTGGTDEVCEERTELEVCSLEV